MKIEVNGVHLFFDVEGARLVPDGAVMREKPTLILLHGGPGMDGSYWKPWFSALADVAQVIYLDQRGCGRSDRGPVASWTLAQWGDDVRAFCDALEIERPIVCGSSFGGEVAMSYATRHPEHPGKLILLSCSARLNVSRMRAAFARLGGDLAGAIAEQFWTDFRIDRAADYVQHCIPLYFRTPQDPDREKRAVTSAEVTLEYLRPDGEAQRANFLPVLSRVQCPTLVMGGEDDPVTPIQDMAELAAALPKALARFERIPDCGHGPFFDRPDRTLEVIREFILS
ncbi:MAG TPA: alpha/beta hydrolase [Dehalococcoidia bacterium]